MSQCALRPRPQRLCVWRNLSARADDPDLDRQSDVRLVRPESGTLPVHQRVAHPVPRLAHDFCERDRPSADVSVLHGCASAAALARPGSGTARPGDTRHRLSDHFDGDRPRHEGKPRLSKAARRVGTGRGHDPRRSRNQRRLSFRPRGLRGTDRGVVDARRLARGSARAADDRVPRLPVKSVGRRALPRRRRGRGADFDRMRRPPFASRSGSEPGSALPERPGHADDRARAGDHPRGVRRHDDRDGVARACGRFAFRTLVLGHRASSGWRAGLHRPPGDRLGWRARGGRTGERGSLAPSRPGGREPGQRRIDARLALLHVRPAADRDAACNIARAPRDVEHHAAEPQADREARPSGGTLSTGASKARCWRTFRGCRSIRPRGTACTTARGCSSCWPPSR